MFAGFYGVLLVFSGQFWRYHYLSFLFSALLLICAELSVLAESRAPWGVKALLLSALSYTQRFLDFRPGHAAQQGAVAQFADTIEKWAQPDARIQPID